jgi:hypothetical protein
MVSRSFHGGGMIAVLLLSGGVAAIAPAPTAKLWINLRPEKAEELE